MRWSVLSFGVAAVVFAATLVCAWLVLPDPVVVYRAPAEQPDVMYRVWQFLTLVIAAAAVLIVGCRMLVRALSGLVAAFVSSAETAERGPEAANWVSAWLLLCLSALIGVMMWFGNDDHLARSLFESLTGLLGLAGISVVMVLALRGRKPRPPGARPRDSRSTRT